MNLSRKLRLLVAAAAASLAVAACGGGGGGSAAPGGDGLAATTIKGSGATFPKAFYEAAIEEFQEANPGVVVEYPGGGSGKGRTDLQAGLVDFAGSDGLVKDEDRGKFKGELLYIPTVAAPITVSYNLPGVDRLVLDAPTLARIFQRDVKRWDAPEIAALNPDVRLPGTDIVVVHRSDGSGTTENFTRYLVKAAPDVWRLKSGSTVEWPPDTQAGNGNAGVAQVVKNQSGAIGYVDLADAKTQNLEYAELRNASGRVVAPTLPATSAALEGVTLGPDLTYDPLDSKAEGAYPIAAPTWILVYRQQPDRVKGEAVKAFLRFLVTDGQDLAEENDFARLPRSFTDRARQAVESIEVPAA